MVPRNDADDDDADDDHDDDDDDDNDDAQCCYSLNLAVIISLPHNLLE